MSKKYKYPQIPKEDWGVHETHCCILHGCKYGNNENCPVCNGLIKQRYICETCNWVSEENNGDYNTTWLKINKSFKNTQRELKLERIVK